MFTPGRIRYDFRLRGTGEGRAANLGLRVLGFTASGGVQSMVFVFHLAFSYVSFGFIFFCICLRLLLRKKARKGANTRKRVEGGLGNSWKACGFVGGVSDRSEVQEETSC